MIKPSLRGIYCSYNKHTVKMHEKVSLVLRCNSSKSVFDARHDSSLQSVTAAGRVGTLAPNFST